MQAMTDVGKDVEKDLFCTASGNANWCSHCGKRYEVPQKINNRTTLHPNNCTTRYLFKGYRCAVSKGHIHPNVYSSAINNGHCWLREQVGKSPLCVVCVCLCVCVCVYTQNGVLLDNQKRMKSCHVHQRGWKQSALC